MIVVDASIAVSWFLADEHDSYAISVLTAIDKSEKLFVPSLWFLELTNAMIVAERRKRIDRTTRLDVLEQVRHLPLKIAPSPSSLSLPELQAIAVEHGLSAYDAEYLRIAKNARLPLATLDRSVRKAASRERIPLFQAP